MRTWMKADADFPLELVDENSLENVRVMKDMLGGWDSEASLNGREITNTRLGFASTNLEQALASSIVAYWSKNVQILVEWKKIGTPNVIQSKSRR